MISKIKIIIIAVVSLSLVGLAIGLFFLLKPDGIPEIIEQCLSPRTLCQKSDGTRDCYDVCTSPSVRLPSTCECGCPEDGDVLCGNRCCESCYNGICCTEENYVEKDGKKQCCTGGFKPSADKKTCEVTCGTEVCPANSTCNVLSGLDIAAYTEIINTYGQDVKQSTPPGIGLTDGNISFCKKNTSTCNYSDPVYLPEIVDIDVNPYYNNKGGDGLSQYMYDLSKTPKAELNEKLKDIRRSYGIESAGSYCSEEGEIASMERLSVMTTQASAGECSWDDCYTRAANLGTIDVRYDDITKNCIALKVPPVTGYGITTDKIFCSSAGVPCANCTAPNTYVEKCDQAPGVWEFKDCIGIETKNNVLNFNNTAGGIAGSCPWGCNDPSPDITPLCKKINANLGLVRGQELGSGSDLACYEDGVLRSSAELRFRPLSVANGFVCEGTYVECDLQQANKTCFGTRKECENAYPCDEGWQTNKDHTLCNTYKCTDDSSPPKEGEFTTHYIYRNDPACYSDGCLNCNSVCDDPDNNKYFGRCYRNETLPHLESGNAVCSWDWAQAQCRRGELPQKYLDNFVSRHADKARDQNCEYNGGVGCIQQIFDDIPMKPYDDKSPTYMWPKEGGYPQPYIWDSFNIDNKPGRLRCAGSGCVQIAIPPTKLNPDPSQSKNKPTIAGKRQLYLGNKM